MNVRMTPGARHGGSAGDARAKILIVDDYEATRATFVRLLELEGFQAEAVECGLKGVQRASASSFDAILCDLRLPDISGLDVLSQLKMRGVTAPVVIMTRFPELDSSFEAGARGAAGFIAGMLIGDELLSVVNQAIRGPLPVHLPEFSGDLNSQQYDVGVRTLLADPEIHRVLELFDKDPSHRPKTRRSARNLPRGTCIHVLNLERRVDSATARMAASWAL